MALLSIYLTLIFDVKTDRSVFQLPWIGIGGGALNSWKQGRLADAEASLTGMIENSGHQSHHAFASRALVRAHLRHWVAAIDDAEEVSPFRFAYLHASAHSQLLQVYQDPTFRHWLHCKKCRTHRRGKKGGGL